MAGGLEIESQISGSQVSDLLPWPTLPGNLAVAGAVEVEVGVRGHYPQMPGLLSLPGYHSF